MREHVNAPRGVWGSSSFAYRLTIRVCFANSPHARRQRDPTSPKLGAKARTRQRT